MRLAGSQADWERLATNLRVERALLPVLNLLSDLPVVVFKGGVLTRLIYGDLRVRASADNDLWVEQPHCSVALERLLQEGFRPLPGLDARMALRRAGQVALWPAGDMKQVSLDLHAQPFTGTLFDVETSLLKAHLIEVPFHDISVTTFDRPLALVHMVAHFLQHRLERAHLREIGAAWDAWPLQEGLLRSLAAKTCGEASLEHALWLCAELGFCTSSPLALSTRRARLFRWLNAPSAADPKPTRGRVLSVMLADPKRLPRVALDGVILDRDELDLRYGRGWGPGQIARRAMELLLRG